MSAMSALVFDIDEELIEAMSVGRVDNVVMLGIARRLSVPFEWVDARYKELLEDW